MDLELAGKRALVTGGSRGIGRAVARALAAEGADVAILSRGGPELQAAREEVGSCGPGRVVGLVADTRDDAQVREAVASTVSQLGGVDVLVNAAARPSGGDPVPRLADLDDDALRTEVETKVLGYLRCARAVAPHMAAQGWGRIISISGLAARKTGSLVGSVRNVAVAAMTKNLADELGPSGINVTVVHPGLTVTERTSGLLAAKSAAQDVSPEQVEAQLAAGTSIGRLVTADEVAAVVAFLASPRSVAITGDAVAVGGGVRGPIHY